MSSPNYLKSEQFSLIAPAKQNSDHPPRILILYGSLRARSYSRLLAEEAGRILEYMGAEVKFFDPKGLPVFDQENEVEHPKVQELRELSIWSEGQVWSSPELHGNISGLMKTQIDWIPLSVGAMRPTQGRTLAVMQVSGGSQSFNAVNSLRVLGRWMRMITIPNQSSERVLFTFFLICSTNLVISSDIVSVFFTIAISFSKSPDNSSLCAFESMSLKCVFLINAEITLFCCKKLSIDLAGRNKA